LIAGGVASAITAFLADWWVSRSPTPL